MKNTNYTNNLNNTENLNSTDDLDIVIPLVSYSDLNNQKSQIFLENNQKSGIYCLTNKSTGQKYVGSSFS